MFVSLLVSLFVSLLDSLFVSVFASLFVSLFVSLVGPQSFEVKAASRPRRTEYMWCKIYHHLNQQIVFVFLLVPFSCPFSYLVLFPFSLFVWFPFSHPVSCPFLFSFPARNNLRSTRPVAHASPQIRLLKKLSI